VRCLNWCWLKVKATRVIKGFLRQPYISGNGPVPLQIAVRFSRKQTGKWEVYKTETEKFTFTIRNRIFWFISKKQINQLKPITAFYRSNWCFLILLCAKYLIFLFFCKYFSLTLRTFCLSRCYLVLKSVFAFRIELFAVRLTSCWITCCWDGKTWHIS
jgi:hypothetical protein